MNTIRITEREPGRSHGFIRRLVAPDGLAEQLKPFVLLDHVAGRLAPGTGFPMHPHSGIATLTYHLDADVAYEDTTGQSGIVRATGLEWMRAGGGTWHKGTIHPHGPSTVGFQLWLALPAGVEDGPSEGTYVPPEDVPEVGNVRVLLGTYEGKTSPIAAPSPVLYLDVSLAQGESWTFSPPADHDVRWAYVHAGAVRTAAERVANELVVFDGPPGALEIHAESDARFLVGTARKHAFPLVLGNHSVHTNRDSLRRGEERIERIGQKLAAEGRR